jgi:hypothetical protein
MNMQELMEYIGVKLPDATVSEDNDGQIIINTNMCATSDETLVSMDNTESYGCPICQESFPTMHDWELHMDYCETMNGTSCEMCGAVEYHKDSDSLCAECYLEEQGE